ncbi:TPA: BglG family transcription antiterminator [Streptococcus pyogenes]|uniref:PRD domain-containing protein n=2 Tax=Streptococcus pyogenes TaxID=1314 RepID=A0A5S4TMM9_STRPY|nr:putative transcriptional antiterminator [Streptococcus pyogenes MGAS315]AIG47138.1 transcription antiterminator BglG [Streptococcus pyogenes STAB902]AYO92670.1 PRD domain-containing protein [Streptococcus pyogenes]EZK56781.1 PTS system mannitol (cryptic)-specific IIA component [Streptococcus pyogenes ABC020052558]EZK63646.1 PTS system mannitol (cryptic)-specific IIA component [Streptococcus pyogenes ABC020048541]EZK67650.1 PTS system mannitol (cryptic)-specific IIA component [Streptococcus 
MLSKKELAIITFLIHHKEQFVSSATLAEVIGMSDRTVRKYLKELISSLPEHGAHIISKQGRGYCLEIDHSMAFDIFWQESVTSKKRLADVTQVEESVDREDYVLHKFFFEDAVQDFEELCQELYISRTTLKHVLAGIKERIIPYQLELEITHQHIQIKGKEEDIRHFIMDYFFVTSFDNTLSTMVGNTFLEGINFAEIMIIVLDECRDAKLKLSDFVMNNLVLHIALMVQRIRSGCPLELFSIPIAIRQSDEYQVALRILYRVEEVMGIRFPKEEANYIALHLKVKHSVGKHWQDDNTDEKLQDHLKACIAKISQLTDMTLETDTNLFQGLLAHMMPLTTRLENHIQLTNPLTEEIKSQYPEIFTLTKQTFSDLLVCQKNDVSDDEWAYISLHLMAAIERYSNRHKLRVLVVCATGYGSAMMLKNRLEKEFEGRLRIVDVISYYEITEERLKTVDLIISSISLANLMFLTPVITVSVFLSNQDIETIRQFIGEQEGIKKEVSLPSQMSLAKAEQLLTGVFSPNRFLYLDEKISKEDLLLRMIACLDEAGTETFVEDFYHQMVLRENYSPVIYGEVLAFPHPANPMTYSEQVVVAICRELLSGTRRIKLFILSFYYPRLKGIIIG